jgi:energy-coupling factor transporter ATP-binding protein EcfA2
MIRFDNVGKQHGNQILFVGASAVVNRGEKVGLVGPNGAGKSTLFRLVTREEQPDEGQVSIDRGVTVGHFSQDVGEMKGRSALAEAMDGAGEDWTVSGDAMRWSPGRSGQGQPARAGVDVAAGIGAVLRVHPDTVRRVVNRAVTPFALVAADVLDELRGLTRPSVRRPR